MKIVIDNRERAIIPLIKALNEGITLKNRMSFTENQLEKDINFIDT